MELTLGDNAVVPLAPGAGGVWSAALSAAQASAGAKPTDANAKLLGFLRVYRGAAVDGPYNVVVRLLDARTPPVPVVTVAAGVRRTPRVVAVHRPDLPPDGNATGAQAQTVTQQVLALLGDDYDMVDVVFDLPGFVANRYHGGVRNSVLGVGLAPQDAGAAWGSAARLIGFNVFPSAAFFDLAEDGSCHEIGHQWINFCKLAPIATAPHWPRSTLARGIMGFNIPGSNVGGTFPFDIAARSGGGYEYRTSTVLGEFTDLDLYLMGLLPPEAVGTHLVATDQNQSPCHQCALSAGATPVTVAQVVAAQGERLPNAANASKGWRLLTIVATRERPLTDAELALYEGMAARAETTAPVPYTSGLASGTAKGFRGATRGLGTLRARLVPPGSGARGNDRVVPIVLDVESGATRFTTELALSARGPNGVVATATYVPSLGTKSGGGTVGLTLAPGEQVVFPDAVAWLRSRGLAIPTSGPQGGTLTIRPTSGLVAATARTTAAVSAPFPDGRAGLAYSALSPTAASVDPLVLYGLRADATDRSNVALLNPDVVPVTVRVTAFSGARDGVSAVLSAAETLAPGEWRQLNNPLAAAGIRQGWVVVERTSAAGSFSAYGVVNDNATNDGSFVAPLPAWGTWAGSYLTLPALVEAGAFESELVLANRGASAATLALTYRESLSPAAGAGGSASVVLQPGEQRIVPDALAFLRQSGVALGAKGSASFAGALRVEVSGAALADVFVGARTASRVGAGSFGLFYPALYPGQEAGAEAWIYGLKADAASRTNVAVFHAGADGSGDVTLELQAFAGATGAAAGAPVAVTLAPGRWAQPAGFFAAAGGANGRVRVRRLSGTAAWSAYGVVNDGGTPGARTGDGAFVPSVPAPEAPGPE